jgi:predicted extracellular nuclease
VALVRNTTALSGACPTGGAVADLVGFGGANCFEGTAAAPAPSNTTAVLRSSGGCVDTDDNASDFTAGEPTPRNSGTTARACTSDPSPAQGRGVTISEIQARGPPVPIVGQDVVATGTATSIFFTNDAVSGFFMQSRPEDDDRNASTLRACS